MYVSTVVGGLTPGTLLSTTVTSLTKSGTIEGPTQFVVSIMQEIANKYFHKRQTRGKKNKILSA